VSTPGDRSLIEWANGRRLGVLGLHRNWWIGRGHIFENDGAMLVSGLMLKAATIGQALLWAVALEIDERVATRTGDRVCRGCGGWGTVILPAC